MWVGVADHFGWAVLVTVDEDHGVVDRRRVELVESGTTPAPIHYDSGDLDVPGTAALVERVRASVTRATTRALATLADDLAGPVSGVALRRWPPDFPTDVAVLRRPPWEARADAVMYRQVLAEVATARGWQVHLHDAKAVVRGVEDLLGTDRADEVLHGPRARLGPPWTTDHRVALAAAVLAGSDAP